jgi:hypothetical protein
MSSYNPQLQKLLKQTSEGNLRGKLLENNKRAAADQLLRIQLMLAKMPVKGR